MKRECTMAGRKLAAQPAEVVTDVAEGAWSVGDLMCELVLKETCQ